MSEPAAAGRARDAALAAERGGKLTEAAQVFEAAMAAAPDDAALMNSAGGFWSRRGDHRRARALFAAALAVRPDLDEARINLAIAATAMGAPDAALTILDEAGPGLCRSSRFWSVRASAARAAGRLREAATAYDQCLALEPGHVRAGHGKARVALERGDPRAPAYFAEALRASPQDPELWLGNGQALLAAGDAAGAREIAEVLAARMPAWPAALEFLAQIRWEAGEADFCGHYARSSTQHPGQAGAIVRSWCGVLAGADRPAEAAEIARAHVGAGDDSDMALLAAGYASRAGDLAGAQALFERVTLDTPGRLAAAARHALRRGDPALAEALLTRAIDAAPGDIAAWALRDLVWRLHADPRSEWLHGQPGLIGELALDLEPTVFANAVVALEDAHARSARPLGQSVRHGTQTRGAILESDQSAMIALEQALAGALSQYRDTLPPRDPAHPLLRHRDTAWAISGSWSVLLDQAGWHAPHMHPQGVLSSACYFIVPPETAGDPQAGALELGRPPPDLGLDLPPLATISPKPGKVALFPSTLFHGTRRFGAGRRLSVAFDVRPVADPD